MNKETKGYVDKIWNKEAKKQLENELSFCLKEKIELPDNGDYLKLFAETHKTNEKTIAELEKEIDRLNNIISEVNRVLESILFELDQTGEAEQVIEKIEYCVKQLKEKE